MDEKKHPDRGSDSSPADQTLETPPLTEQPTLQMHPPEGAGRAESSQTGSRLSAGQRFGSYRVLRLLGMGGMGEVYEAEHLESGRRLALKILTGSMNSPEERKRFLREGRLAAQVSHPRCVYVFGTEEIEGRPAISMEMVPGGTLKERLDARGRLPVTEAVDAALQVIEGLEAAAAVGVLHRDIKPSNCFVADDGTIKVGDFGLSVSTMARDETQLTAAGSILGTPSFASPEQLQGKPVDLRSDIYSVGAMLYQLLTGRPPFEAPNTINLIATIVQEAPASPRTVRPEIPKHLAAVVLRCLQKRPSARFDGYAALANALFPFSSAARRPASLRRRFVAGVLDAWLLIAASVVLAQQAGWVNPQQSGPDILKMGLMSFAIALAYYALLEGFGGASIGKRLMGLRLVRSSGDTPGLLRAALRAFVFLQYSILPDMVLLLFIGIRTPLSGRHQLIASLGNLIAFLIIFSSARRASGFAGLHDLASRTRVVHKPDHRSWQDARLQPVERRAVNDASRTLGPYIVNGEINAQRGIDLVEGFDPDLRRKVWIRIQPVGTPSVPATRREVSRLGRPRWLMGRRSDEECWDAYEAFEGEPLVRMLGPARPWPLVRQWLWDLAEELEAAIRDGTLPSRIGLDRIWITSGGRGKLLDFPAPGVADFDESPDAVAPSPLDTRAAQVFLYQAALSALEGRQISWSEACRIEPHVPLPLHAREVLSRLRRGAYGALSDLMEHRIGLLQKDTSVSRWKRFGSVAWFSFVPALMGCGALLMTLRGATMSGGQVDLLSLAGDVMTLSLIPLAGECVLGLLWALPTRGGLVLRLSGLAVVSMDGAPASGARTLWRSAIAWSPVLLAGLVVLTMAFSRSGELRRSSGPDQRYEIQVGGSPFMGPEDAPVTIIHYVDYQCPHSASVGATLDRLRLEYPSEVRVVFKHYPLLNHPWGALAAEAAVAAHAQGRFWPLHRRLLANGPDLSREKILELARESEVNVALLQEELATRRHRGGVDREASELENLADRYEVPTSFVNGRILAGAQPYAVFSGFVEEELNRATEGGRVRPAVSDGSTCAESPAERAGRQIGAFVSRAKRVLRWLAPVVLLIVVAGAVWSVVNPQRSLQDRIAGTCLVPR